MTDVLLGLLAANLILTCMSLVAFIVPFFQYRSQRDTRRASLYWNLLQEAAKTAFAVTLFVGLNHSWPPRTVVIIERVTLFAQVLLKVCRPTPVRVICTAMLTLCKDRGNLASHRRGIQSRDTPCHLLEARIDNSFRAFRRRTFCLLLCIIGCTFSPRP